MQTDDPMQRRPCVVAMRGVAATSQPLASEIGIRWVAMCIVVLIHVSVTNVPASLLSRRRESTMSCMMKCEIFDER